MLIHTFQVYCSARSNRVAEAAYFITSKKLVVIGIADDYDMNGDTIYSDVRSVKDAVKIIKAQCDTTYVYDGKEWV